MRILVTGASGRIGRYVVRELVTAGHDVLAIDLVRAANSPARFLRADLTQAGEVYQAITAAQADAVVHLGAWADAGIVPNTRTYSDNVSGTYNLFQACADLDVSRIISASSAQVYGFVANPPVYLPADEEHPLRPVNCYALSKMAGEQAADYFVANWGLTILSFRFMGVRPPDQLNAELDQLLQDPTPGLLQLWTRTDARDAALACRLALEAESVPAGPYNITGARVVTRETTAELVSRYFGKRTELRRPLADHESPLSCARAEAAFGYRPRYIWTPTERHLEP
ncbi:MAG: NAD(P)-dependent oxidoreductase [Chloroflexi bacterium]|jgi:nucleoside-diphosphate-sugar epimerase|nr:NAD(P)-dependent oxidoreductase [Chloroflexota bacterium]